MLNEVKEVSLIIQVSPKPNTKRGPMPIRRGKRSPPNDRFSAAIDCAQLGVWDADLVAGTCFYSASWKRMLGYADHELRNHPDLWLEFIHPEDCQKALDSGNRHLIGETEAIETEFRLRHRDGRWIWVLDRGQVIARDASGMPTRMIGVQTDITAQKDVASSLQLLHQRIELTLDGSGIGLWSFEPDSGRTIWDARMREIYGLPAGSGEIPREMWHNLLHPEDKDAAEAGARALLDDGVPVRMTFRIVRPDGAVRHVFAVSRFAHVDNRAPLIVGSIWDVTDHVRVADDLASEKERLRVILRSIGDAVLATDVAGRITFANPAAERLLLSEQSDLMGRLIEDTLPLRAEDTDELLLPASETATFERRSVERSIPTVLRRADGSERSVRDLASPLFGAADAVVGTVLVVQDVTRERTRQRELTYLARHDGLTNLLNRTAFDEVLAAMIADAEKRGGTALFYIDLDRFKVVNDTAGHAAGDLLLKLVANAMTATLPSNAVIARLGGDEFAALAPSVEEEDIYRLGREMLEAISSQQIFHETMTHRVGASIGAVLLEEAGNDPVTALSVADAACYASKSRGRNKISIHSPEVGKADGRIAEVRVASELLDALDKGRLILFGQEIRSLSSPDAAGSRIEVLARLFASDGSLIMPGTFIPAAERFDLMGAFDRRVIRLTLETIAATGGVPSEKLSLAINLSAKSLGDPQLWPFVETQLDETGVAADRICFEITETATVNNFAEAERFVASARRAGCRISLDDFGSGLSSFAYLRRFPVDCIKIDGAFVDELTANAFDQAICAAIGTIAAELGIEVVAERVADARAIELLTARGIGFGQGFFLHRPEPLGDLLRSNVRRPMELQR